MSLRSSQGSRFLALGIQEGKFGMPRLHLVSISWCRGGTDADDNDNEARSPSACNPALKDAKFPAKPASPNAPKPALVHDGWRCSSNSSQLTIVMTGVLTRVGSSADFSVCIVRRNPGRGRGSEMPSLGRCCVCLEFGSMLMLFGGLTNRIERPEMGGYSTRNQASDSKMERYSVISVVVQQSKLCRHPG